MIEAAAARSPGGPHLRVVRPAKMKRRWPSPDSESTGSMPARQRRDRRRSASSSTTPASARCSTTSPQRWMCPAIRFVTKVTTTLTMTNSVPDIDLSYYTANAARRHVRALPRRDDHGRAVLRTARRRRSSDRSPPPRETSPRMVASEHRGRPECGPASRCSWKAGPDAIRLLHQEDSRRRAGALLSALQPHGHRAPVTIASSCARAPPGSDPSGPGLPGPTR